MSSLIRYPLPDCKHYHVFGRTTNCRTPLALFWTGSGIELNVNGKELWVEFESNYEGQEPWICVYINDAFISRRMLDKGKKEICIFRNMNPENVKNVRIIKEVQAMPSTKDTVLYLHSFQTDGDFFPIKPKDRKIEFIGDSITSGEGTYGAQGEEDWISMHFSFSNTYPRIITDELHADYRIVSQSGWGVGCAWDNNPYHTLPAIYEQICGAILEDIEFVSNAHDAYDFSSWKPDTIIINLGTNDSVAFHQPAFTDELTGEQYQQILLEDGSFDSTCTANFEKAVIAFLKVVREKNPHAKILWAYGMFDTVMETYLKHAILSYQTETNDEHVSYLTLPTCTSEEEGSRFHPGIVCHQKAANKILDYLKY